MFQAKTYVSHLECSETGKRYESAGRMSFGATESYCQ
jgi:hypothetical protein